MKQITIFEKNYNAYIPYKESFSETHKIKDSLFYDVYKKAEKGISEIIEQVKINNEQREKEYQIINLKKDIPMECSNIIAFTGDRGSGKTSAMISFANLLKDKSFTQKLEDEKTTLYFDCLPIIDPSYLSKEETVIDVILSSLYNQFERYCKKESINQYSQFTDENRRRIYQNFKETYQAIRTLCQCRRDRHDEVGSLESLRKLAAGNDLRNIIYKLVQNYLEIAQPENKTKFLVISVDDLDMNVEQGYLICEELRKYLNLPNVIILFSVKMLQLDDIIKQEYVRLFEDLTGKYYERNYTTSESISVMAMKYIDKLIPIGRRCNLPTFELSNISDVKIKYDDKKKQENLIVHNQQRLLVDEILYLLFEKVGLLLVKNSNGYHHIIPTNLRDIVHLIALLQSMENVNLIKKTAVLPTLDEQKQQDKKAFTEETGEETQTEGKEETMKFEYEVNMLTSKNKKQLQSNIFTIENYIKQHSISESSDDWGRILLSLMDEPWQGINKKIVKILVKKYLNKDSTFNFTDDEKKVFDDIISDSAFADNISIGDVLFILRKILLTMITSNEEKYIALFKIIYSLKLVKLLFLDNIDEDENEDTFQKNKNNLHQMLGALIYVPKLNGIRGGVEWNPALSLQKIYKLDESLKNTMKKDWLLLHTIQFGKSEDLEFRAKSEKAMYNEEAYYESVTQEIFENNDGHTKYFAENHLACITNCLRTDIKMKSEGFKGNYEKWVREQLSVIPLFSVDYIDIFVKQLFKYVKLELKEKITSEIEYYIAIINATRKFNNNIFLSKDNITKKKSKYQVICNDDVKQWILQSSDSFPIWKWIVDNNEQEISKICNISELKKINTNLEKIENIIKEKKFLVKGKQKINRLKECFINLDENDKNTIDNKTKELINEYNKFLKDIQDGDATKEEIRKLKDKANTYLESIESSIKSGESDD